MIVFTMIVTALVVLMLLITACVIISRAIKRRKVCDSIELQRAREARGEAPYDSAELHNEARDFHELCKVVQRKLKKGMG